MYHLSWYDQYGWHLRAYRFRDEFWHNAVKRTMDLDCWDVEWKQV